MTASALPQYSDPSYVAFASPLAEPLHMLGLELVFAAGFALTLRHALARYRAGERWPMFQWLVILAYGVAMELVAFNFYQNYEHAQFTVELYHRKLPLYITLVYVVFHYTGLKIVERLRLGMAAEALLVGLAICAIDVPYDIVGPDAGWWKWSAQDAVLSARWLGVPVTSFYWYLLFGAIFAALCRLLRRRIEGRPLAVYFALAPLVAVAIIVIGIVAFIPFHLLKALGVPDGAIVATHLAGCLVLALAVRAPGAAPAPREAVIAAAAIYGWPLVVLVVLWSQGRAEDAPIKLAAIAFAAVVTGGIALVLPVRAVRPTESQKVRRSEAAPS
jgi:hypothetical protein